MNLERICWCMESIASRCNFLFIETSIRAYRSIDTIDSVWGIAVRLIQFTCHPIRWELRTATRSLFDNSNVINHKWNENCIRIEKPMHLTWLGSVRVRSLFFMSASICRRFKWGQRCKQNVDEDEVDYEIRLARIKRIRYLLWTTACSKMRSGFGSIWNQIKYLSARRYISEFRNDKNNSSHRAIDWKNIVRCRDACVFVRARLREG